MADTDIGWCRGRDGRGGCAWNPVTGCDWASTGCDFCYAMSMARRLKAMGQERYQLDGDPRTSGPGFAVQMHEALLPVPLKMRTGRGIFVNSMSDLFHPKVTDEFIARVFAVMIASPQHIHYALTKRAARIAALLNSPAFWVLVADELARLWKVDRTAPLSAVPEWIWLGVSVENQEQAERRIPHLTRVPTAPRGVRWLSCEPLIGPVDLHPWLVDHGDPHRSGGIPIDWVVVGGESGHRAKARPMHPAWAEQVRDQARAADVGYYYKQEGSWTTVARSGPVREPHLWLHRDGRTATEAEAVADGGDWIGAWHRTGHGSDLLDGVRWDEWPRQWAPVAA